MIEFRSAQKRRMFDNRKDLSRQYNDESTIAFSRPQQNVQNTLNSNYTQIKQLLKQRKYLLEKKAQNLIKNNQNKLEAILTIKDADLKNQARSLGDKNTMMLIQNSEGLDDSRVLLQKIAAISNIQKYEMSERQTGKVFWDSHKQFQRQMKKRTQIYVNQSKQLKGVSQRQRATFLEIQRLENQVIALLTKNRGDPNHIKKAQKFNEEIENRKKNLRETKKQKQKLKQILQQTIQNILVFNEKNEVCSKKRYRELEEIFGGSQNLADFDEFMHNLQTVIQNKGRDAKGYEAHLHHLEKLIKDYQLLVEEVEKYHDEEANIFMKINQSLQENTKFALLEKIYLSGISNKQDQYQLLRKCQSYRKLLSDLQEDRPMISQSLKKISQMNNMLLPVKKAYETEDIRKEQLKKQLKKLCGIFRDLEERQRNLRNFAFTMEQLKRSRNDIQNQLNSCAERGDLAEYKMKVNLLQQIDRDIEKQRSRSSSVEIKKQEEYLLSQLEKINENYEDIIQQIIVQDKKMYIGTYLSKLQKRLSLV